MKIKILALADNNQQIPHLVECHALFDVTLAGETLMMAITDNVDGTVIEVTDYVSGLRWPTAFRLVPNMKRTASEVDGYDKAELVPLLKMLIEVDIRARVNQPGLAGSERSLLAQIKAMHKRYPTNEEDF